MACVATFDGEPLIESKYLAAVDLGEEPQGHYIEAIKRKQKIKSARGTDTKPTIVLKGVDKEWVLNTTNLNFMAEAYGSTKADQWIGYPVVLVAMSVMGSEGKMVPSIRVDPRLTKQAFAKFKARTDTPKPMAVPSVEPDDEAALAAGALEAERKANEQQ